MLKALILGAGPAGMAAAHELANYEIPCVVLDRQDRVGGMCRTLSFDGYLFDIGGHRFLSRSTEVNALWQSILGEDLLRRPRKSRIYFNGKFYDYPLRPFDAVRKLGIWESVQCGLSYLTAQVRNGKENGGTFESWMVRRFGRKLYENFFKSYTEKVWGIPAATLSSDWAAQRIQQLSLRKAVHYALWGGGTGTVKTLSEEFYYPRFGPGQFYDKLRSLCEERGVHFELGKEIEEVRYSDGRVKRIVTRTTSGKECVFEANVFLSSIPLSILAEKMNPRPPSEILRAARSLKFRNFISVNLIFEEPELFSDNWIYIHSPDVKAGRVQNYKNWSCEMVPDPDTTSLGVEYFVSEEDDLWSMTGDELVRFALGELQAVGIVKGDKFIQGFAVKAPNAYPVYDQNYREGVGQLKLFLRRFSNLQVMGRAGLFRYNNSDHAILTGLYAARNVLGERHDLWSVDPDRNHMQGQLYG